ncbi:MAG: hypothetical protein QW039_02955 [Fervidicoccaceae archaeon]
MEKKEGLKKLLISFTLAKLALLLLAVSLSGFSIEAAMTRWDAEHYIEIALTGYSSPENFAFSPFFPILIRLVNTVVGIPWLSASLISNAFSYTVIILIYFLYGERTAYILAFFPTFLAYTLFPYSEAVSLTFIALTLLLSRNGRNTLSSMLSYSISILTSYATAITLPSFLFLKRRKLVLIPIAVGIAILTFFFLETGDPLYYFKVEGTYWGSDITTPWGQAEWILHGWFTSQSWRLGPLNLPPTYWLARNIAFELFFIISTAFLALKGRKFELTFSSFILIQVLCITGVPAISVPRLILRALPSFYGASLFIKEHTKLYCASSFLVSILVVSQHTLSFFA